MDVALQAVCDLYARDFQSVHSREVASTEQLTEAKYNRSFLKKSKITGISFEQVT